MACFLYLNAAMQKWKSNMKWNKVYFVLYFPVCWYIILKTFWTLFLKLWHWCLFILYPLLIKTFCRIGINNLQKYLKIKIGIQFHDKLIQQEQSPKSLTHIYMKYYHCLWCHDSLFQRVQKILNSTIPPHNRGAIKSWCINNGWMQTP